MSSLNACTQLRIPFNSMPVTVDVPHVPIASVSKRVFIRDNKLKVFISDCKPASYSRYGHVQIAVTKTFRVQPQCHALGGLEAGKLKATTSLVTTEVGFGAASKGMRGRKAIDGEGTTTRLGRRIGNCMNNT